MDSFYYISLLVVGVITTLIRFVPEKKFKKAYKNLSFLLIVICLIFQFWYGLQEKRKADYKDRLNEFTQDELSRKQTKISENIEELKEKEKKGLLKDTDYSRYIAYHLENINLTLQRNEWKNMREWVTTYYDEVNKIPSYFLLDDWKDSEKFIHESFIDEINGNFNSRNMYNGGVRLKVLETFNKERDRLLASKEKEFNKTK